MSLGIPSGPGVLPLDRFLRQVSYVVLENIWVSVAFMVVLFSSLRPSLTCHGYCLIAHMHSGGWSVGSEHSGACLWNASFCVLCMMLDISSGCVARFPFLSIRQSSGVA